MPVGARDDARVQHGRFPGVGKGLSVMHPYVGAQVEVTRVPLVVSMHPRRALRHRAALPRSSPLARAAR